MDDMIFVLRNKQWWCNIEGAETDGPVVYRVPVEFYRQQIAKHMPAGITTHGHHDYTGRCHFVNVSYRANGVVTLHTGAAR